MECPEARAKDQMIMSREEFRGARTYNWIQSLICSRFVSMRYTFRSLKAVNHRVLKLTYNFRSLRSAEGSLQDGDYAMQYIVYMRAG
jgi:hypothetical protein